MTTSSEAGNNPVPRRSPAWSAVLINQLAFPGLGTIMAGRRVGYLQAGLMLAGFFLTMGFMIWYLVCISRYLTHPGWSKADFVATFRPHLWSLYWGIGLCAVAWLWSLKSSLEILRKKPA